MPIAASRRNEAIRTPQFYLLWGILFINVTAGIGILAQASPMMQDMFKRTPLEAGVVVSLISLFNAGGRFMWASGSDYIGRRNTYTIFFVTQFFLFLLIPQLAASGNWWLFQASLFVVFTMYGGGFATIPAFLADIFGPQNVGAIHGALLTAWTAAAIVGPVIITELSNRAKAALPPGADRVNIYDTPLQVLAGLLAVGFVLTLLVRPLRAKAQIGRCPGACDRLKDSMKTGTYEKGVAGRRGRHCLCRRSRHRRSRRVRPSRLTSPASGVSTTTSRTPPRSRRSATISAFPSTTPGACAPTPPPNRSGARRSISAVRTRRRTSGAASAARASSRSRIR